MSMLAAYVTQHIRNRDLTRGVSQDQGGRNRKSTKKASQGQDRQVAGLGVRSSWSQGWAASREPQMQSPLLGPQALSTSTLAILKVYNSVVLVYLQCCVAIHSYYPIPELFHHSKEKGHTY